MQDRTSALIVLALNTVAFTVCFAWWMHTVIQRILRKAAPEAARKFVDIEN
jgi:peptidoglycan/LPS O-acetylase OafA/YrhL